MGRLVHRVSAAHVSLLACAALFCMACARETPIVAGTPTVEFRATPGSPEYGATDVIHLGRGALDAVRSAKPTDAQWREIMPVRVNDSTAAPMLGAYSIEVDRIRFTPRFPPVAGNTYIAQFDPGAFSRITGTTLASGARGTWTVVAAARPSTTTVTTIYPTSDDVPMNLLKLYIHFSAPMSVGESMRRIRVLNDAEQPVEDAFLIPAGAEELWNPEKTRLTLLFDPGRIKRDLRPNEELGLPLQEGRTYAVVIDSAWRDAQGVPLATSVRKTLRVGAPDRSSPRPGTWRVTAPAARSTEPLVLAFPESLEHALLSRMLVVRNADGDEIAGTVEIGARERRWQFLPQTAWSPGSYYIEVDTDLEDLAGNSIRKLFDVTPEDTTPRVTTATVRVSFAVR